jgi:hypothetical protein
LLGLRVRIPPGRMDISWEFWALLGRYLCGEPITRTEESYQVWCVWVCSGNPDNEDALAQWGLLRRGRIWNILNKLILRVWNGNLRQTDNKRYPISINVGTSVVVKYERVLISSYPDQKGNKLQW